MKIIKDKIKEFKPPDILDTFLAIAGGAIVYLASRISGLSVALGLIAYYIIITRNK